MAAPSTGGDDLGDRSSTGGDGDPGNLSSTGGEGGGYRGDLSSTGGGRTSAGGEGDGYSGYLSSTTGGEGGDLSSNGGGRSSTGGGGESVEDAFLRALDDGDLVRLKGIVNNGKGTGPSLLRFNKDDYAAALNRAACRGNIHVCKYLVEEIGVDPKNAASDGTTPLMASTQSGDVSIVHYFLECGGDLLKADENCFTALHHAVCAGSPDITQLLLSSNMPVDIEYGCGTPLFHAALSDQDQTMTVLLNHGADPNSLFNGVVGPLMAAVVRRSSKCTKLLIKAGADVNGEGSIVSPLLFAADVGGRTSLIELLLNSGADPNIPDDWGRLPIELAAIRNCKEEVDILFPFTNPIPNIANWSADGVMCHAKSETAKPMSDLHSFTKQASSDTSSMNETKLGDLLGFMLRMSETAIGMTDCIKVYTTPPDGEFRFVVEYEGEEVEFVFEGRAAWFHGWVAENIAYEFSQGRKMPFINHIHHRYLKFSGNYNDVAPNKKAGQIMITLQAIRDAFKIIRWCHSKPQIQVQFASGTWVVILGEASKFRRIFRCCCRAILDKNMTTLDAFDESLGVMAPNWGKLCLYAMSHLLNCLAGFGKLDLHGVLNRIANRDIPGIVSVQHVLDNVCYWTFSCPGRWFDLRKQCASPVLRPFSDDKSGTTIKVMDEEKVMDEDKAKASADFGVSSGQNPVVANFIEKRSPFIFRATTWTSQLPLKHCGSLLSRNTLMNTSFAFTQGSPLRRYDQPRTPRVNGRVLFSTATTLLRLLKR